MLVIDGKKIAKEILINITQETAHLPFVPIFCDVLAGSNPVSAQYVNMKAATAERAGIKFLKAEFPESISTEELVKEIQQIGQTKDLCGLIVQLPLPEHINKTKVLDAINPLVDVDCIGSVNKKLFYSNEAVLKYPTAEAILRLLDSANLNFSEKKFLVIGQGQLVGLPVAHLLQQRRLNVKTATSLTENLNEMLQQADVVVSAAGRPGLVVGQNLKPGAVIIDAGTAEATSGGIVGDVDFSSASKVAGFISPVPGGVGPVTVACLLENVLQVAKTKI